MIFQEPIMPELSIVIPAFNEERVIGICVKKAKEAFQRHRIDGEVVVADNNSTDQTSRIAETCGARVILAPKQGYGSSCIAGLEAARGQYLIMGDADDSYNFSEIMPFLERLREGREFVIGNRFRGKIEKGAMPFLHRHLGTPVLSSIVNLFFRTKFGDINCGMRGMTKSAFERMKLRALGMEFATEMVIKAALIKLKIDEVPCNLYKDKRNRAPHLKTWTDGWRHLRFILLFKPQLTFFVPGIFLFCLGGGGMCLLAWRDIVNPNLWPMIHQRHMLSLMLIFLLGTQIISLGIGARAFGYSNYFEKESRSMRLILDYFSLERGVALGLFLIILAAIMFGYLFTTSFFGIFPNIPDLSRLNLGIFAITFFMTGVIAIYTSFMVSLFYLKLK